MCACVCACVCVCGGGGWGAGDDLGPGPLSLENHEAVGLLRHTGMDIHP